MFTRSDFVRHTEAEKGFYPGKAPVLIPLPLKHLHVVVVFQKQSKKHNQQIASLKKKKKSRDVNCQKASAHVAYPPQQCIEKKKDLRSMPLGRRRHAARRVDVIQHEKGTGHAAIPCNTHLVSLSRSTHQLQSTSAAPVGAARVAAASWQPLRASPPPPLP